MTLRHLPAAVVLLGLSAGFAHAALTTDTPPAVTVERFEDGSGRELRDERTVRTWPEGTFDWDCTTDGNRVCGPGASPAHQQ